MQSEKKISVQLISFPDENVVEDLNECVPHFPGNVTVYYV